MKPFLAGALLVLLAACGGGGSDTGGSITTDNSGSRGSLQFNPPLRVTGLSASDFKTLKSRLSLIVDAFEIEQNGLGFNNLIYMAVVLSELTKNPDSCYRGLIVEEPEAHLHPQLQAVLLQYLQSIQAVDGEKPVQLFVTSHSPNFASIADLDSLVCLVDTGTVVETFLPRSITFDKGKREKLERYLDVTRAELFFARRVIFVEGAAELMMVDALAKRMEAHEMSCVANAAQIIARLHARGKPNEQQARGLRPPESGDDEFALESVGLAIRDLGWSI